ncbi:MAG: YbhB/YbcL family Raf kinase inhibitor-like protein [Chloroflexi bacterium]|nr:YbhB/YbcL family Raf kinase inhibitor-like protein [Chloroflexota bacterium]
MHVESPAYGDGGNIPVKYSCDGQNISPPLTWSGVPEGTQSLVLIMDDPDAPVGTFTHWLLYDLPADIRELPEGAGNRTTGGIGTAGQNSRRQQGYTGPCPPSGSNHRYIVTLYALDKQLGLGPGANKRQVLEAIEGHILAEGQLMGRYARR